jgi:hypothetical protein
MKNLKNKILVAVLSTVMILSLGFSEAFSAPALETLAATIRVSPAGTDTAGCGSSTQPCASIQYAVNQAVSGDTILVAAGTYKYRSEYDQCTTLNTRPVVCVKNKQLTILGGFSNTNWETANPTVNLTVIDGESSRRGVAIMRTTATASLTMQGFTIENGQAVGQPVGNQYKGHAFGAGMYVANTFVNLKDIVFRNNIALGGSSSSYAQAGWAFGGGLAIEGPSTGGNSTLENITFTGNKAQGGSGSDGGGNGMGGGLMAVSANVTANTMTFINNEAIGGNTAGNACAPPAGGFGGAISLQYSTNLNFSHIVATGNKAIGATASGSASCGGPGIGGAYFLEGVTFNLSDSSMESNQAIGGIAKDAGLAWAGGLYTEKVNLNLERVKLIANFALAGTSSGGGKSGGAGGGGAYISAFDSNNYTANLTNCLFAENIASKGVGPGGTGGGGGLFVQAVTANVTHSTFANNQLMNGLRNGQGALVIALNGMSGKQGVGNFQYSAFTDHQNQATINNAALMVFLGNTASLSYVWFGNNTNHFSLPAGTPTSHIWTGTQSGGYISPGAPDYDYSLLPDSPLKDIGEGSSTALDIDGLARPVNMVADIGSYEYRVPTLSTESPLQFLTDADDVLTDTSRIDVENGSGIQWTASTSAEWIYLGSSGSSQMSTGLAGENLIVRVDPSKVPVGEHHAVVVIEAPSALSASIDVYLTKATQLQELFLPSVLVQ